MLTSTVKKYELDIGEVRAIEIVRQIIDDLNDEDFFDEDPFCCYNAVDTIDLMNELLNSNGEPIG